MTTGNLVLSYYDSRYYSLDCGIVTQVNDNIKANTVVTPIVSYSADNAFVFDTGATETLSFKIVRRNPDPENITSPEEIDLDTITWNATETWSNCIWKKAFVRFVDRWQMKTDGLNVRFTPIEDAELYQNPIDVNGYISRAEITYDISSFEVLTIDLTIFVGSMNKAKVIQ